MTTSPVFLSILVFYLASITHGNPVEVRAACNADNCLRELRGRTSVAVPFCSSYYTATKTTTTTVIVPALNPTLPNFNIKRHAAVATITAIAPELVKKTVSIPTYVTDCTRTSQLSSACSCILGSSTPVTTTTTTFTSTLPIPPQCATSGGLSNLPVYFTSLPGGQGSSGLGFETLPGGCCNYCYATPNCIAFYELLDFTPGVPGDVACSLEILGGNPVEPFAVSTCPLGLVTVTLGNPLTTILYGAGPCATVVNPVPV